MHQDSLIGTNAVSRLKARSNRFLICFGAQRSGTTWLHRQLSRHPAFSLPPRKELRYFDSIHSSFGNIDRLLARRLTALRKELARIPDYSQESRRPLSKKLQWLLRFSLVAPSDCNDDWYVSLFDEVPVDRWTGDFSPDYALLPDEGLRHMTDLLPEARLIFLIRHPVDRLWSGILYAIRAEQDIDLDQRLALAKKRIKSALQRAHSDYRSIFERYQRHWPEDQVLYVFHKDIESNPHGLLQTICDHLNVAYDDTYFPIVQKPVNRTQIALPMDEGFRNTLLSEYRDELFWLADRFGGPAVDWAREAGA